MVGRAPRASFRHGKLEVSEKLQVRKGSYDGGRHGQDHGRVSSSIRCREALCLKIRKILFPLDNEDRISLVTPAGDPDQLHGPIIAAYDEAIRNM